MPSAIYLSSANKKSIISSIKMASSYHPHTLLSSCIVTHHSHLKSLYFEENACFKKDNNKNEIKKTKNCTHCAQV